MRTTITKEQFWAAYNKFPPNIWTKFIFKYFSKQTKKEDKWLENIFIGVEIVLFLIGMLGAILKWNELAIVVPTIIFGILLAVLVLGGFVAVFMNNFRINKIRKELGGISIEEYNRLAEMYSE
jgi:magnesium-transporting ATPase (P-type)